MGSDCISSPDHCLSFYFTICKFICNHQFDTKANNKVRIILILNCSIYTILKKVFLNLSRPFVKMRIASCHTTLGF